MVVYVEYVFINNLITDYALLRSALLLTGKKSKKLRIFLVAILGAICAVIMPFISEGILPIYKASVGVVIGLLSVSKGSVKEYLKIIVILFAFTFFIGGALIGVSSIFGIAKESIIYIPIQLILILIIVLFSVVFFVREKRKIDVNKFVYDCKIFVGEFEMNCKGFLDTGNRAFSGNTPVVICSKEISKNLSLAQKNTPTYRLNLTTVAGVTTINTIENAEILIYFSNKKHIHKKIVLGLTERSLVSDIILHPSLIN